MFLSILIAMSHFHCPVTKTIKSCETHDPQNGEDSVHLLSIVQRTNNAGLSINNAGNLICIST
jgi:hypothetical protein